MNSYGLKSKCKSQEKKFYVEQGGGCIQSDSEIGRVTTVTNRYPVQLIIMVTYELNKILLFECCLLLGSYGI